MPKTGSGWMRAGPRGWRQCRDRSARSWRSSRYPTRTRTHTHTHTHTLTRRPGPMISLPSPARVAVPPVELVEYWVWGARAGEVRVGGRASWCVCGFVLGGRADAARPCWLRADASRPCWLAIEVCERVVNTPSRGAERMTALTPGVEDQEEEEVDDDDGKRPSHHKRW